MWMGSVKYGSLWEFQKMVCSHSYTYLNCDNCKPDQSHTFRIKQSFKYISHKLPKHKNETNHS